jgi:hypothetical protein
MIEKIKIVFYNKGKCNLPEMPSKSKLINAIYYDLDWSNKTYALEWWSKHGHFNEDLYKNLLLKKLDAINELKD